MDLAVFSLEHSFMIFPFEASASLPICLLTHEGKMYSLLTSLSEIVFVDLISRL